MRNISSRDQKNIRVNLTACSPPAALLLSDYHELKYLGTAPFGSEGAGFSPMRDPLLRSFGLRVRNANDQTLAERSGRPRNRVERHRYVLRIQ